MPIYKTNYFFTQRGYGWSETFYCFAIDVTTALDVAKIPTTQRVALLGGIVNDESSPRLREVRVSNIDVQRDSLIYTMPEDNQQPTAPLGSADNPNLAILCRCEAGDLYRRQLYIRGQPDELVGLNGRFVPLAPWVLAFNRYVLKVLQAQLGILAITRPPTIAPNIILLANALDGSGVNVTTFPAHGLTTNDSVRIQSAPGTKGVVGNWTVVVIDGNNFKALGAASTGVYRGGGKYFKRVPELHRITSIITERATHRITGRPFDAPVGRRRRRARA